MKFIARLILMISLATQSVAFADEGTGTSTFTQFRRGLATVVLVGLGGAVLGLSTLSFYPQPQEKIGNVTAGFGIGLLAGTVYVVAQASRENSSTAFADPLAQEKALFMARHRPVQLLKIDF